MRIDTRVERCPADARAWRPPRRSADSSPSPSASEDGGAPTRAGTSFRTATEIEQGQTATANGSTGDYLYWSFPADAGQRPTVKATVKLPDTHAAQTWQIDVYDGLRRRQACQYGAQTRTAAAGAVLGRAGLRAAHGARLVGAVGQRPAAGHVLRPADGRGPRHRRPRPAGRRRGAGRLQGHRRGGRGGRLAGRAAGAGRRGEVRRTDEDGSSASAVLSASSRRTAGRPAGGPTAGCGPASAACWPRSRASAATR